MERKLLAAYFMESDKGSGLYASYLSKTIFTKRMVNNCKKKNINKAYNFDKKSFGKF